MSAERLWAQLRVLLLSIAIACVVCCASEDEDLAIDIDAGNRGESISQEFDHSHIAAAHQPSTDPIRNMPCEVLREGASIPFDTILSDIISVLRDVSAGSKRVDADGEESVINNFVCPPASLMELTRLIAKVGGSPQSLDGMQQTLRSMAMEGYARLGTACSVDILVLCDGLHHWSSELAALQSAAAHAEEDCTQAWAHFIAFIQRSADLQAPKFRSERCIPIDEYRACFDLTK